MFVHSTTRFGSYSEPYEQPTRDHGGRHVRSPDPRRVRRRRRRLLVLLGGLSVLVAGGAAFAGTIARSVDYKVVAPVSVQALGVSASNPAVGEVVMAGAKVVAEQDQTFDEVRLAVRDQNGRHADFPSVKDWQLGTSQKELTAERSFDTPGIYTYWFAYRQGTHWTSVNPKRTFKVGSGVAPGGSATPGPSTSPIPEPSGSPTGAPSSSGTTTTPANTSTSTTAPTTTPTVAPAPAGNNGRGCAAFPAMPDASCTGVPTGTVLHSCSNTLNVAGAIYDGCLFNGTISVQANNVTIKNSKIAGGRVDAGYGNQSGLVLMDVEIDGGNRDNTAGIGEDNYTCIRCNVWRTGRGANAGTNVVIRDSWFHDFYKTPDAHMSGIGTNGGNNNQIIHNNIDCQVTSCSGALVMYGDFEPISNMLIQNNLFNTPGSYCTYGGSVSGKAYPHATNVRYIDNLFGKKYTSVCGMYGPYTSWENNSGNAWSGNRWQDGSGLVG